MKKLAFTTAIALALATAAYAQGQHGGMGGGGGGAMGGGGGGGPGASAHGPSMGGGGGGPSPGFSAQRAPGGGATTGMGSTRGTSGLFNRTPTNQNFDRDRDRFSNRDRDRFSDRRFFNRADRDRDFNRDRDFQHRGIVRGDFFEHGRHFRFRRFFHGQVVFLTAFDDCTAWAWVHVAPGTWAWRPINICIG